MTLPRFIGVTELRNNVRRVFDRLRKDHEPVVVIRESKPEAVILPYTEFESLMNGRGSQPTAASPQAMLAGKSTEPPVTP